MPKGDIHADEELGVLEDKTEALTLRSKRTERQARKKHTKKPKGAPQDFLSLLPYELILEILTLLKPGELFLLQRTSKSFYHFIAQEEARIARAVSEWRYASLQKSFRLPVLVTDIDPAIHHLLQIPERQEILTIHKKPYQHIQPPDPTEVCTCLTCTLRWSALSIIVDFAHWQHHLDKGEPIPMIPRGRLPEWNQAIISAHANIVRKALHSPLWHARLLEVHLDSTTRSIRRNVANKGNKRKRFRMTDEDVNSGTDAFLDRSGPPSLDFPYHRDNYYLLETFVPNRSWSQDMSKWLYVPAEQHDRDVEFVVRWAERRRRVEEEERGVAGLMSNSLALPGTV
ncbi:hypothetical protein NPX13_g5300 [Xylaria arbuscula]|uniref:F-box domain-containing protein n=1 Tax=Xylaria arbuscula TaxID=114810 RepID=A0A9W8NEQ7_9PEZI|nr:hypothetical protein NPX13_g5300 [Xylaria arbuscula]